MSTPNQPSTLQQRHRHLLEIAPTLRPHNQQSGTLPDERLALDTLNATLKRINLAYKTEASALYQALDLNDANQLTQLKTRLVTQLQTLDETSTVNGQSRKTYLTDTAGIKALEQETRLNVSDALLSAADQLMLEDCSRGPSFRPGMYALTFNYQDQSVPFAGAFVLTRQASPTVDNTTSDATVGPVLLFTPLRGLEAFASLKDLDSGLLEAMTQRSGHAEFSRQLPVKYQHLDVTAIWPLVLEPITGQPLFEHVYQAQLDKRENDIHHALSQVENGQINATLLKQHLDDAINAALPDLTPRLDVRSQRLLERDLFSTLPDWYRSAAKPQRETVDQHLRSYNQARQAFIDLLGPAGTPHALARHQWAEQLADELDIHDLDPDLLHISTLRTVPHVGTYEQQRSLVELTLRGLHPGDSTPGSAFLERSTLSYAGAPLGAAHTGLNMQTLLTLLQNLQPRLDFASTQKAALATAQIKQAAQKFFDLRLLALAYVAKLQGHLSALDFQRFEDLRERPHPLLRAQTVLLHGAQLNNLWVLREDDEQGQIKRLLLCTPDAPSAQQFITFSTLRECQTHIIGWTDNMVRIKGPTLSDYLLEQVPLRFKPKMRDFLLGISLRPDANEHLEVTFGPPCTYTDCLEAMASHRLAMLQDDYAFSSPAWYRAASMPDRMRLASLADNAAGALRIYNARPDAEARVPSFEEYLHQQAKLSLNRLLGRRQNDVDPDTVFAYAPTPLFSAPPAPVSYTTLYRDGYEDGIGFLNEKFSASATFRGPADVDLSALTAQNVARSVTGVWIGQRYTDEIRRRLQNSDSPGYDERRDAVLAIVQLQMKSAALESRLQGHIASADLVWLDKAIDSLSDTGNTARNTYKVHRLSIDGDWVIGNYLFSHGNNPVLLYTPDAPDGIGFREARLFNYLLKKVEGMPAYWCGRVALSSMARVTMFLKTAREGLPAEINRSTPSPARHDSIQHVTPLTDLRHEFYNMNLQRKIDDVHATTVNRLQMITGILWTCVEWLTAVATMPFPLLSLTLGGLLAFKDAMLALNAYHQNDKGGALQHYLGLLANVGGALLFDVRPALKSGFKSLRPMIRTSTQAADSALISQVDILKPEGMQPVLFDGRSLWAPHAPDALGRYVLYRHDPLSGQLQSTARLVNRNADGQWVRTGVAGGGRKKYEKLLADESSALEAFDVAPDQAKTFRSLLDPAFKLKLQGMEPTFSGAAQGNAFTEAAPLRTAYAKQVEQLTQHTDAFYQALPAPAPKSPLPMLATDAAHGDILKALFTPNKRLIIGAVSNSIASKQLLIEQLPTLAELGLKRVYIENLPRDLFHRKLKILNGQLGGSKAHALAQIEQHLIQVDQALGFAADAPFTYRKLLLETQRLNIAIDGLDGAASYHMEHILALGDGARFIPRSSKLRNFYAQQVIEQNLKNTPDEGWVALVESNRLGTYEQVPGLADLQNTPALRVEDVAAGQHIGVSPDTISSAQSRGDYTLAMPTSHAALHTPSTPISPLTAVTHYAEFDLPQAIRSDIDVIRQSRRGLDTHYSHANPRHATAQYTFSQTRRRLLDNAQAYFNDLTLPSHELPESLATATNETIFVERLYQHKLGLVIGEAHSARASKRLLIDTFKHLKQQGVRTLYIEHLLTDLHQEALDTYRRTLKMPAILENYLLSLDAGHMPRYHGPDTFTNVVKTANKYGFRVRALDCTASYHVKGLSGVKDREHLFSYFANQVITADQRTLGSHKWVAFMGSAHTDMYVGVPGIAQLQDAVSLHVRDTAPELAKPLHSAGWQAIDESQGVALRSDFRIEVGVPGRALPPAAPLPDRSRLTEPGQFFIERPTAGEVSLVHFSRSNEILTTPIQINEKGQFFIERWEGFKQLRFDYLSQLIEALKSLPPRGMGMKHMAS
ncbi:membrane-targeted effector domain-containing toxin [Pseudomonas kairouanensis]|uniref:Membrane-targeted effector domain-containing toxin n=1 Tax=Pseudomonas kairouanensis TaxID=2293832 RepID=A0A4Z0AQP1_9PSED|nr:membrane-targeted effector domain-containing toxin [Pseudomonas kairouanensis]TFY88687.1 membrane-targeted effector domain-containing toxin [Pseudomonas kairouanensis]